ncbi:hypothetical protein CVT91_12605 [Candidatus Atribacteria bacterium HGW-Atribacteria-1]|nr:MAG: hypothetical protein CVT91_12605 [Candidatus Atribacteria bacterium HGW-Atribacteria-1]
MCPYLNNTSEDHRKIAQAIQKMWKKVLGVEVNLTNQEWKVYLKTLSVDAPQIFCLSRCADYPDANNWVYEVFHSTDSENRIKWHNAEEAGIAPIYFCTIVNITKPYLKRTFAPMGGEHIKDWRIKK